MFLSKKLNAKCNVISIVFLLLYLTSIPGCTTPEATPEYFGQFKELPITSISPGGWAKEYLINQRNGLTGYLDEHGGYPFNTEGWSADSITNNRGVNRWWPYEQTGYWIDGMIRSGYLLQDSFLIDKANRHIYYTLDNAHPDGYVGPLHLKPSYEDDRWVHTVFFRSLMAEYLATGDRDIIDALRRHYLHDKYPHTGIRESTNLEIVLFAYAHSGDTALLSFAKDIYRLTDKRNPDNNTSSQRLMDGKPTNEHGVTYNERAKLGAILYMYTGKQEYLDVSIKAYQKLDQYHMLISGVNVSSEHIGLVTSQESHEACDIADFMWSNGYLLMATGDTQYADKLERAIFNAAPGAIKPNVKAFQYFSAPNQVILTRNNFIKWGDGSMQFGPNPSTECCAGNVNRIIPNYIARSWMKTLDNGLAAATYVPSTVSTTVGAKDKPVTVRQKTDYPFSDTIRFQFTMKETVEFPFLFRIPEWCTAPELIINGVHHPVQQNDDHYVELYRSFSDGDVIELILPHELKLVDGPENGISVEYGPLVYSLRIDEEWKPHTDCYGTILKDGRFVTDSTDLRCTKEFPVYEVYPDSPWNYALCLTPENIDEKVEIIRKPMTGNPWYAENTPIKLQVPARRVHSWEIQKETSMVFEEWVPVYNEEGLITHWEKLPHREQKGEWLFTPALPDREVIKKSLATECETVTLIPYGASKLRLTVFPRGM